MNQRSLKAISNKKSDGSCEGLDAGDVASKNQVVNVMGAFVGFDRLKVRHVSHHRIFIKNTICAVDVT